MSEQIVVRFAATGFELGDGRTVVGRCVPYDTPALVADGPGGMPYREMFRPGAFRKSVKDAPRVELRHEHGEGILDRIGRARSLHEEDDGLYGEFVIVEGQVGDHARELVRSQILGGLSVSAIVYPHASETLPDGTVARSLASLRHVGLCAQPAYPDAKVLAMRSRSSSQLTEVRAVTERLRLRSPATR